MNTMTHQKMPNRAPLTTEEARLFRLHLQRMEVDNYHFTLITVIMTLIGGISHLSFQVSLPYAFFLPLLFAAHSSVRWVRYILNARHLNQ